MGRKTIHLHIGIRNHPHYVPGQIRHQGSRSHGPLSQGADVLEGGNRQKSSKHVNVCVDVRLWRVVWDTQGEKRGVPRGERAFALGWGRLPAEATLK